MKKYVALIAIVATVPFLPVLSRGYFQADDFGYISLYHSAGLRDLLRTFVADWSPTLWGEEWAELRPLVAISFALDARIWGTQAFGFHLTNVLMHLVNCWLVFLLGHELMERNTRIAGVAAVLFALSPSHSDTVSWITGRVDLIAPVFFLASALTFVRFTRTGLAYQYWSSLLLFGMALLSKESALVLPVLLSGYFLCYRPRRSAIVLVPFFAVLACYLLLRMALFSGLIDWVRVPPLTLNAILERQLFYLRHLLTPGHIVTRARWALVMLVGLTIVAVASWRRTRQLAPLVFFGPVWYSVTVLPMFATHLTPRHLYLVAAGVSLFLAYTRFALGRFAPLWLAFWLLLYGSALIGGNLEWVKSGEISWKMKDGIERLVLGVPAGSTIVLGEPPSTTTLLWQWALPYALQPPFSTIYNRYTIIEPQAIFCCPRAWGTKESRIRTLMTRGTVHVFYWDQSTERIAAQQLSSARLSAVYWSALPGHEPGARLSTEEASTVLKAIQAEAQKANH